MSEIGFIEVSPCYLSVGRWKEITIDTGAAQSTLRDIKLPESAGGYAYQNSNRLLSATRNRFIYWRTSNDILELAEVCLDVNLLGNQLRLRFQNTPILEGISINETASNVVILVSTVGSLHRLIFPHPEKLNPSSSYGSLQSVEITRQSIFFDSSVASFRDPGHYHLLNHNSIGMLLPHTSCSWITSSGESIFVLANNAGSLLVFAMPSAENGGSVSVSEMRHTSVMGRLWSGLVPSIIRGSQESEEVPLSLVSHAVNHDVLIFALCRDLRIRLWSYEKKECLMTMFVLEKCCDGKNSMAWNVTGRQPCLRKAIDEENSTVYLGVFLGFPEERQFCIFQPVIVDSQYRLHHVSTLHSSESDLIDFYLTSTYIWTLWLNESNETVVLYTSFRSLPDERNHCWKSVALDTSAFRSSRLGSSIVDPREAYMKEIFSMGKFSQSTICKAISIYRRTPESSLSAKKTNLDFLKVEVSSAVENEIHMRANEAEIIDEEFQRLQLECWEKFYSYCVQYHEVGTKPLGLIIDDRTGVVGIVKKNMFSLLRRCDALEHLILSDGSECGLKFMAVNPLVAEDPSLSHSLQCVLECTHLIEDSLTEQITQSFVHRLANLQAPETIAADIVSNFLMLASSSKNEEPLAMTIKQTLQTAPQLLQAVHVLLNGLDLSQGQQEMPWEGNGIEHQILFMCNQLFNSPAALMVISESLHQMAVTRFAFSCALLLLLLMIRQFGENAGLFPERVESLSSVLIPQLTMFIQGYYFMLWATEAEVTPIPSSVLESGFKQMSLLEASEYPPLSRLQRAEIQPKTLVSLFLQEQGGTQARQLLSRNPALEDSNGAFWISLLPSLVNTVAQLIWPINASFIFPEFLLAQCQYLHIQEYVRLLKGWCELNSLSRLFLLANSHLALGEPLKAVDLFCQAAEGVSQEPFLSSKLLQLFDVTRPEDLTTIYYLKVIQMFEYFNHPDCIISLATAAISASAKDDPQIPTLYSLLFKYHLEVGHNSEAYTSLISNPDSSRRKDCLRQFIVSLWERAEWEELIYFPYVDMEDDVVSILESRARSTDLTCHSYYELLYSYYIKNNNFRRAGTVMYECAMRLAQEVHGVESLRKQVQCFLITLNSLRLVDEKYAWIVKPGPTDPSQNDKVSVSSGYSPKRDADGDAKAKQLNRKIEVLTLTDIKKEYELANARLVLCQKDPSPTNIAVSLLSPEEIVALLVNAGMFQRALNISQAFELSLKPIFEGLVSKCVSLSCHSSEIEESEALEWIAENDMSISTPTSYLSVQGQLWYLLQHYLEKYEKDVQSVLHRCIAEKLFTLGVSLPAWLVVSYKKKNMPELLRLFNNYGRVEESVDLVIEYLDAVMGKGPEHFNLKNAIHANAPPVWIPYTQVDELLEILRQNQWDVTFAKVLAKLEDKLNTYFRVVENTSKTKKEMLS